MNEAKKIYIVMLGKGPPEGIKLMDILSQEKIQTFYLKLDQNSIKKIIYMHKRRSFICGVYGSIVKCTTADVLHGYGVEHKELYILW